MLVGRPLLTSGQFLRGKIVAAAAPAVAIFALIAVIKFVDAPLSVILAAVIVLLVPTFEWSSLTERYSDYESDRRAANADAASDPGDRDTGGAAPH